MKNQQFEVRETAKVIAILLSALTVPGLPAFADSPVTYLALGDSVPFGMNITLVPPYSSHVPTASQFMGYPEAVAAALGISEINTSCPGETSASFLNTSQPDNGCNSPHIVLPPTAGLAPIVLSPFKTSVGLHAAYTGSQMDFAIGRLKTNKSINLVTLSIGANDVLLALPNLAVCGANVTCAQNVLAPVLNAYGANLAQILLGIRAQYQGPLILLTYYSPSPLLDSVTEALNVVMTQVAGQVSMTPGFPPITVLDGFKAFQLADAAFNRDACQAGLLIKLPASPYDASPCDIHPSEQGRKLLAALVELAAPSLEGPCHGTFKGAFVGALAVSAGQTCIFQGGSVTGNITQTGGNLILNGTTVMGDVKLQGGGTFSFSGSTRISGSVSVQNLPVGLPRSQICGTVIGGNLLFQNNSSPVQIGAASLCDGNSVGGNLEIHSNHGGVLIYRNLVTGNLVVENDTDSIMVFSNRVAKDLQCSGDSNIAGAGNTAQQKQGECAAF